MKRKVLRIKKYAMGTNSLEVSPKTYNIDPDYAQVNAVQTNNRANASAVASAVGTGVSMIPGVGAVAGPLVSAAGNLLAQSGLFDNKKKIEAAKLNAEASANVQESFLNNQDVSRLAGQTLPTYAEGTNSIADDGPEDAKSKRVKQLSEEARAYTKDWIQRRKVQNPDFQKQIDAVKSTKLNNIKDTKVIPLAELPGNAVGGSYVAKATGVPTVEFDKYKVGSDKSYYQGTPTHEFKHQANRDTLLDYEQKLIGESIDTKTMPKDLQEYYKDPDEVSARIQGLRKRAGFKPDQVVTKEQLRAFWQKYGQDIDSSKQTDPQKKLYEKGDSQVEDIKLLVPDEKKLLNLLNNLSMNVSKQKGTQA